MSISGENICPEYFRHKYGRSIVVPKGSSENARRVSAPYKFMSPSRIDNRAYCPPVTDDGNGLDGVISVCANYYGLVEWLADGNFDEIDRRPVYERLIKSPGGASNVSVQSVFDAFSAVRGFGIGSRTFIVSGRKLDIKYTIHEFGAAVGCFNISDEWYSSCRTCNVISSEGHDSLNGVTIPAVICGFDGEGVWIQAPWGIDWGEFGMSKILWKTFNDQFIYGVAVG